MALPLPCVIWRRRTIKPTFWMALQKGPKRSPHALIILFLGIFISFDSSVDTMDIETIARRDVKCAEVTQSRQTRLSYESLDNDRSPKSGH
ncbi:uncharacterized protein BDW43DRAFT_219184 [Aspergillus alliaceus]|uniref:uncharacterized protein n=1 Tax=Petromyces alliaceus TaxID=209559 RepID=UPI0012A59570|nr:uncharacterized protein BDW43DRAFT_219184 [Aspergillus alliaceus]KAB8228364.1 hypothetical protein BDW43DRAFT_219184 [Aspergillus alliaceus]